MKKIFWPIVAVAMIAVSSLIVVACSKVDEVLPCGQASNTMKVNSHSPFDYIGEAHNTILYSLGEIMETDFEDFVSLEEKHGKDRDVLVQKIFKMLPTVIEDYSCGTISSDEIQKFIYLPFEDSEEDGAFSSEVALEVQKVFCRFGELEELGELCDSIRNYEIEITKKEMTMLDSQIVACLNVFYHSSLFWEDATYNNRNPWHVLINDKVVNADSYVYNEAKGLFSGVAKFFKDAVEWVGEAYKSIKRKYTWKKILVADVGGALSGCGLWLSSVTGGNSVWISAVASSAIGPLFS